MEYNEYKDYIITKEERRFNRLLDQDDDLIKSIIGKSMSWAEIEAHLGMEHGNNYNQKGLDKYYLYSFLGDSSQDGGGIKSITAYERNYLGYIHIVEYKGITLWLYLLDDERTVNRIEMRRPPESYGYSTLTLKPDITLDGAVSKYLEELKYNKRQRMNYYNAKIKELKQEYKGVLKTLNEEIKRLENKQ